MNIYLLFAFYGLIAAVLNGTLLSSFPSESLRLQLHFLGVVYAGVTYEWRQGLPIVLILGLFSTAYGSAPFITDVVAFMAVYFLIRLVVGNIFLNSVLGKVTWVIVFSLICQGIELAIILLLKKTTVYFHFAKWWIVPQALVNSMLGIALLPFFSWYTGLSWQGLRRPKGLVLK